MRKMNKIIKSLFVPYVSIPLITICGCQTQQDLSISLGAGFSNITNCHDVVIPLNTNKKNSDIPITVSVINDETGCIHLQKNTYLVENHQIAVQIHIDDSVLTEGSFMFDLECVFEENGQTKTITIFDINLYFFVEEPEIDKDRVFMVSKTNTQINNHSFTFRVNFVKKPTSEFVNVKLLGEPTGKLHSRFVTYQVVEKEDIYVDIIVDLDIHTNVSSAYGFDLQISFVNSFGQQQTEFFTGCSALFQRQSTNIVPYEYLDISINSNGEGLLSGFKSSIEKLELNPYTILEIPAEVTKIKDHAFDNNLSDSISKIVFSGHEVSIGEAAFGGYRKLSEIDFTKYEPNTMPPWLEDESKLVTIFNPDNLILNAGYVWLSHGSNYLFAQQLNRLLINIGLKPEWESFDINSVTNELDFNINDTGTLTGFSDTGKERLPDIKVIKIPDNVTKIGASLSEDLQKKPYINREINDGSEQYETRRLIVGSKVESIGDGAFEAAGISGPCLFLSSHLSNIGSSAFYRTDYVGWPPKYGDVKSEQTKIYFLGCPDLQTIDTFAFGYVPLQSDNFILQPYVTTINSFAFYGNQFKQITLNQQLKDIGSFAFSNAGLYPAEAPLEKIDASCYKEDIFYDKDGNPSCIPPWMYDDSKAFKDSSYERFGNLILSKNIEDEFEDDEEKSKFEKDLLANLGLPSVWLIKYI